MSAEKLARTRPYLVIFNGTEHMVEATSQSAAISHLAKSLVGAVRVARGAEVSAWARTGKPILVAGQEPESLGGPLPFKEAGATDAAGSGHAEADIVNVDDQPADAGVQ